MIGTESFINITPCPQWVKLDFAGQNEAENWYLPEGKFRKKIKVCHIV